MLILPIGLCEAEMDQLAIGAGVASTALFVGSYLPMLYRAVRTRNLASYSRSSLVMANVGNVVHALYIYGLPPGPLWFLHGFYLAASGLMLGLHLRHVRATTTEPTTHAKDRK